MSAQGEFGRDIPAGDGKLANLFCYGVERWTHPYLTYKGLDTPSSDEKRTGEGGGLGRGY